MRKRGRSGRFAHSHHKSRKGLSDIVSNLIIILLVLVAMGTLWVVVRNVLSQGAGDIELSQFTFDIGIESSYISGTDILVGVKRNSGGGDLTGLKFVFSNESETKVIQRNVVMQILEERTFTFTAAEIGGFNVGDLVSIAPVYLSSGTEKSGSSTDTSTISGVIGGGGGSPTCNNDGDCDLGETSVGCPADCPAVVCNEDGDCDAGETLANCPADCPAGGSVCGNDICEVDEDSGSCLVDCPVPSSCNNTWTTVPPEDVGVECDGDPTPNGCTNCICGAGFSSDGFGGCNVDPPMKIGTINSVWNFIYVDSHDLMKNDTVSSYQGRYLNFSGSPETRCFQISLADYLTETDISYLRLVEAPAGGNPNIVAGQGYSIWLAPNCGQPE